MKKLSKREKALLNITDYSSLLKAGELNSNDTIEKFLANRNLYKIFGKDYYAVEDFLGGYMLKTSRYKSFVRTFGRHLW